MLRKTHPQPLDEPDRLLTVPAGGPEGRTGAEERVLDGMLDARIDDALRALSTAHQQVRLLVDVDGLSYQEAAQVLGVPVGTVMSRLHRARRGLRRRLEGAGFTPGGGNR